MSPFKVGDRVKVLVRYVLNTRKHDFWSNKIGVVRELGFTGGSLPLSAANLLLVEISEKHTGPEFTVVRVRLNSDRLKLSHQTDKECSVHLSEDGVCSVCLAKHGKPCKSCGACAYHTEKCKIVRA